MMPPSIQVLCLVHAAGLALHKVGLLPFLSGYDLVVVARAALTMHRLPLWSPASNCATIFVHAAFQKLIWQVASLGCMLPHTLSCTMNATAKFTHR